MSISGIGSSLGSIGTTYDFTNVTNAQFEEEVHGLAGEGKLTKQQEAMLCLTAEGGDSIPINGVGRSTAQALSDPTTHNFITELLGEDYNAHRPGSVGAGLVDSLLQALQTYQGTAVGDSSKSVSTAA